MLTSLLTTSSLILLIVLVAAMIIVQPVVFAWLLGVAVSLMFLLTFLKAV